MRSRSAPERGLATASYVSVPRSTVTWGFATRLWYQSGLVHHRVDPLLAGLRPRGGQKQHGSALELPPDLAFVGPELLDHLGIPVVHVHQCGPPPCPPRRYGLWRATKNSASRPIRAAWGLDHEPDRHRSRAAGHRTTRGDPHA